MELYHLLLVAAPLLFGITQMLRVLRPIIILCILLTCKPRDKRTLQLVRDFLEKYHFLDSQKFPYLLRKKEHPNNKGSERQ